MKSHFKTCIHILIVATLGCTQSSKSVDDDDKTPQKTGTDTNRQTDTDTHQATDISSHTEIDTETNDDVSTDTDSGEASDTAETTSADDTAIAGETESESTDSSDSETVRDAGVHLGPCQVEERWSYPDEAGWDDVVIQKNYAYDVEKKRITMEQIYQGQLNLMTVTDLAGKTYLTESYASDGSLSWGDVYAYDSHGNPVRQVHTEFDGVETVAVTTYEYDAEGRIALSTTDGLFNNEHSTFVYEASGHTVTIDRDTDKDGEFDEIKVQVYDTYGNVISIQTDYDRDGEYESIQLEHYTYDDAGHVLFRQLDIFGDGDIEYQEGYEYTTAGEVALVWVDIDGDGGADGETRYEYDAAGRLIRQTDDNTFGRLEGETTFQYDAAGNELSRVLEETSTHGVFCIVQTEMFYDCWG